MQWSIVKPDQVVLTWLANRTAAVIGYGNQGRAHALNLRDSQTRVLVGQRQGPSYEQAVLDGQEVVSVSAACQAAELIIIALPDETAAEVYTEHIGPYLRPGQALGFIHGFNIRFGLISPPPQVDVVMVAPKGPGTLLRSLFVEGKGLPVLLAVEQNATGSARNVALGWAAGLGADRAAVVETTFAVETETDLFGEQAVLCGGVTALCKAAFDTLIEAGYPPQAAYLECVHELKQIVDLIYAEGLSGMRRRISNTAEYGDLTRGPRLIGPETRAAMKQLLNEIQAGQFATEWIAEHQRGLPTFQHLYETDRHSSFEDAGQQVRRLMPWLPNTSQNES